MSRLSPPGADSFGERFPDSDLEGSKCLFTQKTTPTTSRQHLLQVFLPTTENSDCDRDQQNGGKTRRKRRRSFLLAVGMEQTLLCMLMLQRVSNPQPGIVAPPSVDAVYVDRGRALLLELRAQDLLNPDNTAEGEATAPLPALISADVALRSLFRRSSQQLVTQSASHHGLPASGHQRKLSDPLFTISTNSVVDVGGGRGGGGGGGGSDSEEEGGASMPRRSQSMLHLKPSFRQRRLKRAKGGSLGASRAPSSASSSKTVAVPRPPYT